MTFIGFFTLATAMLAPAPDLPTGSRLGSPYRPGKILTPPETALAMQQYGGCMVAKRARFVRSLLLADTTDAVQAAERGLSGEMSCLSLILSSDMAEMRQLHIETAELRGTVAEASLRQATAQISDLPALPLTKDYTRAWFPTTTRNPIVDEMAVCVADTNPLGIGELIRTQPFTSGENAAMKGMMENFGSCLRVGAKLQANRPALRAALADALYQRVYRPAAVAASPTP